MHGSIFDNQHPYIRPFGRVQACLNRNDARDGGSGRGTPRPYQTLRYLELRLICAYICIVNALFMQILRIYPSSVNDRFINQAVDVLCRGGIIVYPTDTLYAVGCDALNQGAIERVCRLKGLNPQKNMLSIVCSGISQASEYARIDNGAYNVIRRYVPGPFTFVLPVAHSLPKAFRGRKTVGVRIPDNAIPRRLAEELGRPMLTTSMPTGEFGEDEIVLPESIALRSDMLGIDVMIDGGQGGSEGSTIVDLTDSSSPEILRQGIGKMEG